MENDKSSHNEKSFQEVSDELRLWSTPDWGIINSDGKRVMEFIQYAFDHPNLKPSTQFEFVELIAASMNDAILEGIATPDQEEAFAKYLFTTFNDEPKTMQVDYWVRIKNTEEFPVGFLIEKIKRDWQS